MTINNINDLCDYLSTTIERIERDIYKYTDCGAWIKWNDEGVTVGSIVEGSCAEFSMEFVFPFTSDDYEAWINGLEYLTSEAWHEANDEDEE